MNVRTLLKKATSLKKQNKVEEAIKVLDQAYEIGIYEPPSTEVDDVDDYIDEDKLLVLADLVRKAKYLQEIGKKDESLVYLDKLIEDTSSRANYNIWEIHELSDIHNHKAIVLKKEKRYNDEFIERVRSYCLRGIAVNLKANSNNEFLSKNSQEELKNLLDPNRILKFVEDNSKKVSNKFEKKDVVGFIQVVINQQYKTDKIGIEFKKLVKD